MKNWLRRLKYYLLRKYLIEEMIRDGWRQDPTDAGRLVHDHLKAGGTRVNMTEHEAVSLHFKYRPLTPRTAPKNVSVAGSPEIRGTAQEPAPTEKP